MAGCEGVYRSPYGVVRCLRQRGDGVIEAAPVHWKLASDKPPTFYLRSSDVAPLLMKGAEVECAYGRGLLRKIRDDGVFEVQLTSWTLAGGVSPVAYLQADALRGPHGKALQRHPEFAVGDIVSTAFGEAVIVKTRWDGVFELKPTAWKLANGASPVLYLQEHAMKRMQKTKAEASVQESIERGNTYKAEGNELFKAKKYEEAALSYLRALNVLRFVPEDLKNSEKAQIIELSVPTHNNLASCYVRLRQPVDAMTQATNALKILEAIDSVIPNGQVYQELLKRGVTDQKLRKDWRIKALFLLGKGMVMRGDFEVAIPVLRKANDLTGDPGNAEIHALLEAATKGIEKHKRESKKLWSKAFQKRSAQIEPDPEEEAEIAAKQAMAATADTPNLAATTPVLPVTPIAPTLDPGALSELTAQITKDLNPTKSFSKPKKGSKTPTAASSANEKAADWSSSSVAMLAVTAAGLLAAGAFLYLRGKK